MLSELKKGFKLACLIVAGFAVLSMTSAVAGPYDKFKGTELVVSWPALPHFELAKKLLPEFEKETGIKVEVDSLQYMKLHDKQVLEMAKPNGDYDVVAWVVFWKTEYVQKGLLTPLSQLFADPALVNPEYDIDDITPAYLLNGGVAGGKQGYLGGKSSGLYGIPFSAQTSMLSYRKDILDKYNIAVPTTYDELLAAAAVIKEKEGMGGVTGRAQSGHHATDFFLTHFAPQGGKILNDKYEPILNGPEGVKTIGILKEMLKTGPVGMSGYSYGEMKNSFVQGDAAFYLDDSKIRKTAENPSKSRVVGKVGYALHPTGTVCGSGTGGFAMGIPANAKQREAAFLFIQWFTSKEIDYKLAEMGGDPVRTSTMNDPALQAKFAEYKVLVEQLKCAKADWRPLIPEWPEIDNQIIGIAVSEAITGKKSAQQALDEAAEKIRVLLKSKGYYNWN